MGKENQQKILEEFVVDNEDLEILESKISNFNIFEAIGNVRYELRHSDFLAFLMDPSNNHGLHDIVSKKILKDITYKLDHSTIISPIDIDTINADKLEVRREWRNIDILIIDWDQENVIAFENKIDASEGDGQLATYSQELEDSFKDYTHLKIFLTPEGREPSESNCDWIAYSYKEIQSIFEKIIDLKKSIVSDEVLNLLKHYNEILRRHILEDSTIKELCRKIYREHGDAIDLIYENKPDLRSEISELLQEKIKNTQKNIVPDKFTKSLIRFSLESWDEYDSQSVENDWGEYGKILLFEFKNRASKPLRLCLVIGPGPDSMRNQLLKTANNYKGSSVVDGNSTAENHSQIFSHEILSEKEISDLNFEQIRNRINKFFEVGGKLESIINEIGPHFAKSFEKLDQEKNH